MSEDAEALAVARLQTNVLESAHLNEGVHRPAKHLPDQELLERDAAQLPNLEGQAHLVQFNSCHKGSSGSIANFAIRALASKTAADYKWKMSRRWSLQSVKTAAE